MVDERRPAIGTRKTSDSAFNPRETLWRTPAVAMAFKDDPDDDGDPDDGTGGEPDGSGSADDGGSDDGPGGIPQDQVNAIVQDRLERERQRLRQEMKEKAGVEDLDEVQQLREELKERREQELKEQEQYKELLEEKREEWEQKLSEKDQRLQELERERRREKVTSRLLSAAQKKGAINPDQVARLVRDQVDVDDDGNVVAVDDDGTPRLDDDGSTLSPEALVEDFLDDNDHFREAASGRGAGGGPNDDPGGASEGEGFDPSKKDDPDHLLEHKDEILEKAKKGEVDVL